MSKKKIEPTDAMVEAVELARALVALDVRGILRAALNHPDAPGLFADETPADARPWEPLNGGRVYVGDEVRRDHEGLTVTAVVGEVDEDGDPWTAEDHIIGVLRYGTWYVRRAVQELPTEDGAVIVPADGREFIETNEGLASALVHLGGKWYGGAFPIKPEQITPGTWKEPRA